MDNDDFLVLGVKGYDFKNDDGVRMQGMNLFYSDTSFRDDNDLQKGHLPMKVPTTIDVFDVIAELPAYYKLDFRQRADGKGKAVLIVVNAVYSRKLLVAVK